MDHKEPFGALIYNMEAVCKENIKKVVDNRNIYRSAYFCKHAPFQARYKLVNKIKNNYKCRKLYNILTVVVHGKISYQFRNNECHVKKCLKNVCYLKGRKLLKLVEQKSAEKHLLEAGGKKRSQNINRNT